MPVGDSRLMHPHHGAPARRPAAFSCKPNRSDITECATAAAVRIWRIQPSRRPLSSTSPSVIDPSRGIRSRAGVMLTQRNRR
jgi:hypothetical protein